MQQQQTIIPPPAVSFIISVLLPLLLCLVPATATHAQEKEPGIDAMCMLKEHNSLRARVGNPELRWSEALARQATAWANKLKETGCAMQHSRGKLGENLYWAGPLKTITRNKDGSTWKTRLIRQSISEKTVVGSWANEQRWYSQTTDTCNAPPGKTCGHYTQIIWKNTKEVGCSKAVCDDNSQVWVCNYAPAGNVVGQRPY